MKKEIYRIEVQVGPMEGTQLPDDFLGAFSCVYLPALTIRDAIDAAEQYLLADKYSPLEITAAVQLDLEELEYERDDEGYPDQEELQGLLDNGGYSYGPFVGWTYADENEFH